MNKSSANSNLLLEELECGKCVTNRELITAICSNNHSKLLLGSSTRATIKSGSNPVSNTAAFKALIHSVQVIVRTNSTPCSDRGHVFTASVSRLETSPRERAHIFGIKDRESNKFVRGIRH